MKLAAVSEEAGWAVSRETYEKLSAFHDLLLTWSKTHNLIGPRERDELWPRHIVDCLKVWPFVSDANEILDVGSGAGLPGLVLACCASPNQKLVLVESNTKRCSFLRHVSRELSLPVQVENRRVEDVSRETVTHITARAVADLTKLFTLCEKWLDKSAIGAFQKGRNWKTELTEAQRYWNFNYEVTGTDNDSGGVILNVSEVRRVQV